MPLGFSRLLVFSKKKLFVCLIQVSVCVCVCVYVFTSALGEGMNTYTRAQ